MAQSFTSSSPPSSNPDYDAPRSHSEVAADPTAAEIYALSNRQERRLVEHLDDRFLQAMRGYKTRSQADSTLPTLDSYLDCTHVIFALIMQIPPIDPSISLRIALLLRLTGDVLACVPGYTPNTTSLEALLAWLADLDTGWVATLRRQGWDTKESRAHDVILPDNCGARAVCTTERARLRSLIIEGTDVLQEWLSEYVKTDQDFDEVLERMGVEEGFGDVFTNTLAEMGALGGVGVSVDHTALRID